MKENLQWFIVLFMLAFCFYYDKKNRTIPNYITYTGILMGVGILFFYTPMILFYYWKLYLLSFVFLFILYYIDAIGGGDVKLLMALIFLLGINYTVIIVTIAMLFGLVYVIITSVKKAKKVSEHRIPLGSFLFLAFLVIESMYIIL